MSDNDPPNDPFSAFEADRTVIKPSAGRGARAPAPGPAAPAPMSRPTDTPLPELPAHASLNPLVQAAAPLLSAAPRLRASVRHPDPAGLRANLVESIKRFEAAARARGLPNDQVVAARYILCTFIDESASSTPWGGSGAWSSQSLLVHFHNEAWGGEKVFQLLTRLAENPTQHRNLLELVWVALSLGFEGRYKVLDNGRAQLDGVREKLTTMLQAQAGTPDRALSVQWQGVAPSATRLRDGVPLWVLAAGTAVLLTLVFVALRFAVNVQTDATFTALQALDARAPVLAAVAPLATPQPAPPPRLAQLLRADIAAGLVQVRDQSDSSVVTVTGDTLFDPGSADVAARAKPLFGRIAEALNQLPGAVQVTGHTDNQPIRSLRFPSNWHLSKERALSVRNLLAATVKPDRLAAEGRADSEPVADNSSADGRAKNRRVEVTLTVAAAN